jgi:hypothetical protein
VALERVFTDAYKGALTVQPALAGKVVGQIRAGA